MVQVVMNGVGGRRQGGGGFVNGKPQAPPSDSGLGKNKSIGSNGSGLVKPVGRGGDKGKGVGGTGTGTGTTGKGPRKLTKNEKRRQKNKEKKAQAVVGVAVEKSMAESNGVAVASWPPPPAKEEVKPDVQVRSCSLSVHVVLVCKCVLANVLDNTSQAFFCFMVLRVQAKASGVLRLRLKRSSILWEPYPLGVYRYISCSYTDVYVRKMPVIRSTPDRFVCSVTLMFSYI